MIENNINNFNGIFIGTVLEINKETRKIAVYIPKLMPALSDIETQKQKVITNPNNKKMNVSYETSISKRNSIWVSPFDYNEALPKVNSKVRIEFLENNPKLGFWRKFNPNNDFEVIDEEKYEKRFEINIGGKTIVVNQEDKIIINLPEELKATVNEEEKEKTFNLFSKEEEIDTKKKVYSIEGEGRITNIIEENGYFKYSLDNGKTFNSIFIDLENDDIDDASILRKIAQDLTLEEKSQVRKNIGAISETDLPTKLSEFQNDTEFITKTVNNLTNYYLQDEIYTKQEVGELVSALASLNFEIVETLPIAGNINTIYLILRSETESIYNEYIFISEK